MKTWLKYADAPEEASGLVEGEDACTAGGLGGTGTIQRKRSYAPALFDMRMFPVSVGSGMLDTGPQQDEPQGIFRPSHCSHGVLPKQTSSVCVRVSLLELLQSLSFQRIQNRDLEVLYKPVWGYGPGFELETSKAPLNTKNLNSRPVHPKAPPRKSFV